MHEAELDPRPHLVIAGASGPIGRRLVAAARDDWRVTVLTREVDGSEPSGTTPLAWNPTAARDGDVAHLEGLARVLSGADALVNLAGASIGSGRFGPEHRRRVLDSRIDATTTLVQAALRADRAPRTWLQGSAVGLYGDRGEEELDAASEPDRSFFLGQVGVAWEEAAAPIADVSRLVVGRIGVVLAPDAEAWRKLLLPIRLFVGGPLGSGRQWWPWIHGDDLTEAMLFLLRTPAVDERPGERPVERPVDGVFVLSAPEPARQIEITRAAAERLRRPSFVPVPAFALRIALGGLPDMLLLPSAKVRPRRLLEAGFEFRWPTIREAVAELLPREGERAA